MTGRLGRTLERRREAIEERIDRRRTRADVDGPVFVGQIINGGHIPKAVPGQFLVRRLDLSGTAVEGGIPGSTLDQNNTELVTVIGPGVPSAGHTVLCEYVPGGWAAEYGSGPPPCSISFTVRDCITLDASNRSQYLSITGGPAGGQFVLSFAGGPGGAVGGGTPQQTAAIAYNASAGDVQSALEALSNIGAGNVTCSGGPLPNTPVTIDLVGALAPAYQPLLSGFGSFTGGNQPQVRIESIPGNAPDGATYTLASNEQQRIVISGATGGQYELGFGGQTATLAYNATAADVLAALQGLPSIGDGNITIAGSAGGFLATFAGSLAGRAQALITADGSGLNGDKAQATVTRVLAGGTTIGPGAVPPTGQVTASVGCGSWTIKVQAPLFITQTKTITLPNLGIPPTFTLVPQDGYLLLPGSNTPSLAPPTASLVGDPGSASTLGLATCIGGLALYSGTGGPQTFTDSNGNTYIRQSWFVAGFGCGDPTLSVIWTINAVFGDPGGWTSSNCSNARTLGGADCGPNSDLPGTDTGCPPGFDFCSCTNPYWPSGCALCATGIAVGYHSYFSGGVEYPFCLGVPTAWIWGGGCFSAFQIPSDPNDPNSPMTPGWTGPAVNQQIGTLWGTPFGTFTVPEITASLD